jgi:hypothetical protein
MNTIFLSIAALLIFVMFSQPAQAYLDPGSGSLLFQLIVGGVFSALFAIKIYYRKIKVRFGKKSEQEIKQENNETNETTK